jgi:hypothetical protein
VTDRVGYTPLAFCGAIDIDIRSLAGVPARTLFMPAES